MFFYSSAGFWHVGTIEVEWNILFVDFHLQASSSSFFSTWEDRLFMVCHKLRFIVVRFRGSGLDSSSIVEVDNDFAHAPVVVAVL